MMATRTLLKGSPLIKREWSNAVGWPEKMTVFVAPSQGGAKGMVLYTGLRVSGPPVQGHAIVYPVGHEDTSEGACRLPLRHGKVRQVRGATEAVTVHHWLACAELASDAHALHATHLEFTLRCPRTWLAGGLSRPEVPDRRRTRLTRLTAVVAGGLLARRRPSPVVGTTHGETQPVSRADSFLRHINEGNTISAPPPRRDSFCLWASSWVDDSLSRRAFSDSAVVSHVESLYLTAGQSK